ncbi:MAG: hypothetical protein AAF541_10310 [Pseudomonadota bacterium]
MNDGFKSAPLDLQEIISTVKESEYATLTRAGMPVANPLFHYFKPSAPTIDIATGLAYPSKADRVRDNPRLGLLLGSSVHAYDPIAMLEAGQPADRNLQDQPIVAIAAMGAVRDRDLQANTDKYVDLFLDEHPAIGPSDWQTMRTMTNYWVRIWVECTPVKIWWWPDGNIEDPPCVWENEIRTYPNSDTKPNGVKTPRANWPAEDWRERAESVVARFPQPVLTSLTPDGFPIPLPTQRAERTRNGFRLALPATAVERIDGQASLSFGALATFTGEIIGDQFVVHRLIGNLPSVFQNAGDEHKAMATRQSLELARRNQKMPLIRQGAYFAEV